MRIRPVRGRVTQSWTGEAEALQSESANRRKSRGARQRRDSRLRMRFGWLARTAFFFWVDVCGAGALARELLRGFHPHHLTFAYSSLYWPSSGELRGPPCNHISQENEFGIGFPKLAPAIHKAIPSTIAFAFNSPSKHQHNQPKGLSGDGRLHLRAGASRER
jgi:hypothetical protein